MLTPRTIFVTIIFLSVNSPCLSGETFVCRGSCDNLWIAANEIGAIKSFLLEDGHQLKVSDLKIGQIVSAWTEINVRSGPADWQKPLLQIEKNQQLRITGLHTERLDNGQTQLWLEIVPTDVQAIRGAQSPPSEGPGTGIDPAGSQGTVDNFLPNVQNQLASGIGWITKQKEDGTGSQIPVTCSSFETQNNQPTFFCSNTGEIKVGDLVVPSKVDFWGFSGPGYIDCPSQPELQKVECDQGYVTASRVINLVPNTSITIQGDLGGVSPTQSSQVLLAPIVRGDLGHLTRGMDGWKKTATLTISPDDFASNAYPGTIRPLLMRKGKDGDEEYIWDVPESRLNEFRGRIVTCEAAVWQKRRNGSGTWQLLVNDDENPGGFSEPGSGTAASNYEVRSVTHRIGEKAKSVVMGVVLRGAENDVLYLAGPPTCAFVDKLSPDQMHMNSNTKIRATGHWNPPLLTPYQIEFRDIENCAPLLFCKQHIDLEAISFGAVHRSVSAVDAKIEWLTTFDPVIQCATEPPGVGGPKGSSGPGIHPAIFTGTYIDFLSFSLEAHTQVPGVTINSTGTIDLNPDGTFIIFSDCMNSPTGRFSATFDFWNAYSGLASTCYVDDANQKDQCTRP